MKYVIVVCLSICLGFVDSESNTTRLNTETCLLSVSPPLQLLNPKSKYVNGDTVTFTCDAGYALSGSSTSTCAAPGIWKNGIPTCKKACLLSVVPPLRIQNSKSEYVNGDTVRFTCDAGYRLSGRSTSTCTDTGRWRNGFPTCQKTCSLPASSSLRKSPSKSFYVNGDSVTFSCDVGYSLSGINSSHCTRNGSWSNDIPMCAVKTCRPLHLNPELVMVSGKTANFVFNDTIKFSCEPGYDLVGDSYTVCIDTDKWSIPSPNCTESRALVQNYSSEESLLKINQECHTEATKFKIALMVAVPVMITVWTLTLIALICTRRKLARLKREHESTAPYTNLNITMKSKDETYSELQPTPSAYSKYKS